MRRMPKDIGTLLNLNFIAVQDCDLRVLRRKIFLFQHI